MLLTACTTVREVIRKLYTVSKNAPAKNVSHQMSDTSTVRNVIVFDVA